MNLQTRHVPWPGIELEIFQLWGNAPTNWVTLAKAEKVSFKR